MEIVLFVIGAALGAVFSFLLWGRPLKAARAEAKQAQSELRGMQDAALAEQSGAKAAGEAEAKAGEQAIRAAAEAAKAAGEAAAGSAIDKWRTSEASMKRDLAVQEKDHSNREKAFRAELEKTRSELSKIASLKDPVDKLSFVLADNKLRGGFGEVSLRAIVDDILPRNAEYEYTIKEGSRERADCVIRFPGPPGMLAVDAKFSVPNFLRWASLEPGADRDAEGAKFSKSVRKMLGDIADKYIVPGRTADCALMFIPSESVFGALHRDFPEVIEESQKRRVWITSPSTLGAVLLTFKAAMNSSHIAGKASELETIVGQMIRNLELFDERMDNLRKHYDRMGKDFHEVEVSRGKIQQGGKEIRNIRDGVDELSAGGEEGKERMMLWPAAPAAPRISMGRRT